MAVVTGKCKWAKLLTPSEATKDFKSKYTINLYVDATTKKKLEADGLKAKVDKETKEEYFVFWTSGAKKDGTMNPTVRLIDMQKNPINEEPGNGSTVLVQYIPVEYSTLGNKGVFGALQGVQVKNMISRMADEFEADDDALNEFVDDVPF